MGVSIDIYNELKKINDNLENMNNNNKVKALEKENYKLRVQVHELYEINKDLLNDIIQKGYKYSVMIDKPYIEMFTNQDIGSFESEIITIPLNKRIIDNFNEKIDEIYSERYKEINRYE